MSDSVDKILKHDQSKESDWAVFPRGTVWDTEQNPRL